MAVTCRFVLFMFVIINAILVPRIIRLYQLMHFDRVVHNQQPGHCENIKGLDDGSEDMQALPSGVTFVTVGLMSGNANVMMFDVNKPSEGAQLMTIVDKPPVFKPHGISIWQDEDGISILMVNHLASGHSVERFSYDPREELKLTHVETFTTEVFFGPNDLVAVGHRKFYFTNSQYYSHDSPMYMVELLGTLEYSTMGYFDGTEGRILVDGLRIGNGINVSPDLRYLYLVNSAEDEILVYEMQQDGDVVEKQVYKTDCGLIDNIDVDPTTGDIWAGVHPVGHKVFKHLSGMSKTAPSMVLHFKTQNGLITEAVQVYAEDGEQYVSGSSVAIKYQSKLVIGTVAHKAAICDIHYDG